MEKLGDFIDKALNQKGLGGAAEGSLICFWADEWGKGRFHPISFARGTLKVSVDCASAAQELQMDCQKLVKYLNLKAQKKQVFKIRIENHEFKEEKY